MKIGQSLVFLDGKRRSCRLGECILGNLVTDSAVFEVASRTKMGKSWTEAAIALWTANSIMASIEVNRTGLFSRNTWTMLLDYVTARG